MGIVGNSGIITYFRQFILWFSFNLHERIETNKHFACRNQQRPHATRNRNGDVHLFGKGLKEYIGSASLLDNLRFDDVGELVPKGIIEKKTIAEVITDEQFDDLDVYIPYTKDGKLIIPVSVSEKHARSWSY